MEARACSIKHGSTDFFKLNYWINITYQKDDPSGITQLRFDETSRRKGHSYITVSVDLEKKRVLHVVKGKNANTIKGIKEYIGSKGVIASQISQASIDLSSAFTSGITEHFPDAEITFDHQFVRATKGKGKNENGKVANNTRTQETVKSFPELGMTRDAHFA